eukprot:scaffold608733_cov40-Prasinocladus_malaysianus.AAC.1
MSLLRINGRARTRLLVPRYTPSVLVLHHGSGWKVATTTRGSYDYDDRPQVVAVGIYISITEEHDTARTLPLLVL